MTLLDAWEDKVNSLRGRAHYTDIQMQNLIALSLTVIRYANQPWYKKLRKFRGGR